MKHIPKRRLIPIITDLIEYRQAANNTIVYAKRMTEKYGDVCEASFTGVKNYFIHDPEVIKDILTTQGPKMKRTYLFRAFRKFLGNGLFTSDGEHHKRQRRLIKPAFYPDRIAGYADKIVECADEEVCKWEQGQLININKEITKITLKAITRCMFGSGLDTSTIIDVEKMLSEVFTIMNKILVNPFYVYCLEKEIAIPLVKRFFLLKKSLHNVIDTIIASHQEDKVESKDLLTLLIETKDEDTGENMTIEQIRDEVLTFFIAGHETTSLAITWTLYSLCRYPEVSDKLYKEVSNNIKDRLPNATDYKELHYTRNVFKESLRMYPPAWTFAREPIEDVIIQDYFFPKGCTLWTITYLLHHDKKYFDDPEKFVPERWESESIKQIPKYAYFPFGGGNRMCIGEGFAWMEGILVLATIALKYKLILPAGFSTEIRPLFTLKTKDDIFLSVQPIN